MSYNSSANEQISNLIMPVSYFVNHVKQLKNTQENLRKYRQTSIVGTSGIGKTQLARTYAYDNKNNYNIIWFFDCNLDLNEEFVKLAKNLNNINKTNISEDIILSKKGVMDYLSHKDKWLLVFDNLKINENKKIQNLVDWENNGNIIFCSQDGKELQNTIEMSLLNYSDSISLAHNLVQNKDNVEFVVKTFKGYPILIVQVAQLLNQVKGLNKKEYQKKIYQSADKIKLNIELAIKELTPTAAKLLNKIALINNQSFSKQILSIITDNKNTIDDDIFQLSKFVLIANTDPSEDNPIFEMHDVIAQKTIEVNGDKNQEILEDIIIKLTNAIPRNPIKSRIFKNAKTIPENLEIIFSNTQKYNISTYKVIGLGSHLITHYLNSLNYYSAEKMINWFNENDQNNKFKPLLMNNEAKRAYAGYLGLIGGYYRNKYSNWLISKNYYERAQKAFDNVNGYESLKFNVYYGLAISNIALGVIIEAKYNINILEKMLENGLVNKEDVSYKDFANAKLLFIQGKYNETLEQTNLSIKSFINNGMSVNDLFLTNPYILKTEILNTLGKYNEAYNQAKQLYEMHKPTKQENHEIFARIYTQLARSELGLGQVDEALKSITKAIVIFLSDEQRNLKEADYSEDPDLAASYVVEGDIFFAADNLKQAIESYKKAQTVYFYLYRDNRKNVAHVSYLYKQGAKAACKAKDLYNYKIFGKSQIKEFGIDHLNTINMFEYCKQHDMDLWAKEN